MVNITYIYHFTTSLFRKQEGKIHFLSIYFYKKYFLITIFIYNILQPVIFMNFTNIFIKYFT